MKDEEKIRMNGMALLILRECVVKNALGVRLEAKALMRSALIGVTSGHTTMTVST